MKRSDSARALTQLAVIIAAVFTIATLYFARVVFIPFALAVIFAFLLAPIVSLLDRIHVPRAASSLMVVAVSVLSLGLLGWVVTGQLVDVANQLPSYRSNIKRKMDSLHRAKNQSITKAADAVNEIGKELAASSPASGLTATPSSSNGFPAGASSLSKPTPVEVVPPASSPLDSITSLVGPMSTLGIVIVFTLFMLIRREDLRNRFIRLVGHEHLNTLTQALDDAAGRVSRYLFLQLSVNLGYGIVVGTGLYLIGIPHVLLWGTVAALLRFLPYVGPVLSAVLPILLSLAMFDGWTRPLLTFGLYASVELIVGNVIEPLLYGAHIGLSSLAILVAAVFWTVLWGPVGLVLSTPLTVCLVVIGRYVPSLGFLNILLGDEPVLPPESHYYQRLLASDHQEAKSVLEAYLKDHTLLQLYDLVLIPALELAEQDRHSNNLDEATQQFITLCTRELVEELFDRAKELASSAASETNGTETSTPFYPGSSHFSKTIVCIPARDEADEIVGTMFAQLLEQAGHRSHCVAIGTIVDMLAEVEDAKPDIVCISALPPQVIAHARNLYLRLRAHSPKLKIMMGLWGFSGDAAKIAGRLRLDDGERVFVSLDQLITEIDATSRIALSPQTEESQFPAGLMKKQ